MKVSRSQPMTNILAGCIGLVLTFVPAVACAVVAAVYFIRPLFQHGAG